MPPLTLWALMEGYRAEVCTFVRQAITSTVKMVDRWGWARRLIDYILQDLTQKELQSL
jgi:hypothetical protein